MNISSKGLDLIKNFEGFEAEPYLCPAGKLTIGYGHTKDVNINWEPITKDRATALLIKDVESAENTVLLHTIVRLYQHEFDALTSFVFNVGYGHFSSSTMLRLLNNGEYSAASREFERWVFADGKTLEGLVKRRQKERELFTGIG